MTIKLHLDHAEAAPIERAAEAFGCSPEDLVYAAVNLYMLRLGSFTEQCGPDCKKMFTDFETMRSAVLNLKLARTNNLPLWADSAGSVHNYEGFGPDQAVRSKKAIY